MPTILIVEDDKFIRDLFITVIKRKGFEVLSAENGAEALNILNVLKQLPDLICSDLEMPVMSGWELCRALNADERYKHIPRLIVSSNDPTLNPQGCEFQAHLLKPVGLAAFVDMIKKILEKPSSTE